MSDHNVRFAYKIGRMIGKMQAEAISVGDHDSSLHWYNQFAITYDNFMVGEWLGWRVAKAVRLGYKRGLRAEMAA